MFYKLKRHPIPMTAHFRYCLVITYAFPQSALQPLIPPGLILDSYGDNAFVAAAMVKVDRMRPAGLPAAMGRGYCLTGYRIFCRFPRPSGADKRGLRILRSDCNSRFLTFVGNQFTHYAYQVADITMNETHGKLNVQIVSKDKLADIDLTADLHANSDLPPNSMFPDLATALHFAGPLPFTFDYEPQTHSIVAIKGVRKKWNPRPVSVEVSECAFLEQPMFQGIKPILANAFYLEDIPYLWKTGVAYPLPVTNLKDAL